ncbi:YhzD family protein [Tuberibacillus sp. Marseille-P3662]|uniref:YhzD family protein n=1 Tax=Tuberibacillus sp. Marseille-P3662 TaxID=1965358 RepID=UPI000A1CDDD2|nr:YhzD family protein [Tuberibacillus sp. Marseille-P3662]
MSQYMLTVFDPSGETLLNEMLEASSENEAKQLGDKRLQEKQFGQHTHRLTSSDGKLVLFHR